RSSSGGSGGCGVASRHGTDLLDGGGTSGTAERDESRGRSGQDRTGTEGNGGGRERGRWGRRRARSVTRGGEPAYGWGRRDSRSTCSRCARGAHGAAVNGARPRDEHRGRRGAFGAAPEPPGPCPRNSGGRLAATVTRCPAAPAARQPGLPEPSTCREFPTRGTGAGVPGAPAVEARPVSGSGGVGGGARAAGGV